ncbi:MAG: hypothetical protein IJY15_13895, partial [Thermoguttaceae bacterium]|nr:hypothetical protein [Thermoguttaceae bacterium]
NGGFRERKAAVFWGVWQNDARTVEAILPVLTVGGTNRENRRNDFNDGVDFNGLTQAAERRSAKSI